MRTLLLFTYAICNSLAAQNCDSLFYAFDYRDENNLITDTERKAQLQELLRHCQKYEAGVWQRMALIYQKHSQYDSVFHYYNRALNITDINRQPSYWNSIAMNIGNIYAELGQYEQALRYYSNDSTRRLKKLDSTNRAAYYYNRAYIFGKLRQFHRAKHDLSNALAYSSNDKSVENTISIKLLEVELVREQKDYRTAYSILKTIYPLRFSAIDMGNRQMLYNQYAYNLGKITPSTSALRAIDTAILLARNIQDEKKLYQTLVDASILYSDQQDSGKALQLIFEASSLRDSLEKHNMSEAIRNGDYAVKDQLNYKNLQIANSELKIKNIWQNASLIVIILILLILIIIYFYYRQKQQLSKQQLQLKTKEIDDLLQTQEIKTLEATLTGQNTERKRIAQELHDNLGGMLSSVKLQFGQLDNAISQSDSKASESYHNALNQLDSAFEAVRKISHDIYAASEIHTGLNTALRKLADDLQVQGNIHITIISSPVVQSLSADTQLELYRISQELLRNTLKHAGASEVNIQMTASEQFMIYSYEDNGIGFSQAQEAASSGIGLKNIRARVEKLRGSMHLDTRPGHGMTLIIEIPIYG